LEVQVHHLISLGGWNDVIYLSITGESVSHQQPLPPRRTYILLNTLPRVYALYRTRGSVCPAQAPSNPGASPKCARNNRHCDKQKLRIYVHTRVCYTHLDNSHVFMQEKRGGLSCATALQSRALTRMHHATTAPPFGIFREHRRRDCCCWYICKCACLFIDFIRCTGQEGAADQRKRPLAPSAHSNASRNTSCGFPRFP
jgi:hypothetical protein